MKLRRNVKLRYLASSRRYLQNRRQKVLQRLGEPMTTFQNIRCFKIRNNAGRKLAAQTWNEPLVKAEVWFVFRFRNLRMCLIAMWVAKRAVLWAKASNLNNVTRIHRQVVKECSIYGPSSLFLFSQGKIRKEARCPLKLQLEAAGCPCQSGENRW